MSMFLLVQDTTGDAIADKRYAYAQNCWREGNIATAIDLARQTLELTPSFVPALRMLADGLYEQGQIEDAIAVYEHALAIDPSDRLGVRTRLAKLGVIPANTAVTSDYVRTLFDSYAPIFEEHLVEMLGYRGPDGLMQALEGYMGAENLHFTRAIDIGCGTGLVGERFRRACDVLIGSDISSGMVELARRKNIYDELIVADATEHLVAQAIGSLDLVLAGDCLIYIADLSPLFVAAGLALKPAGLFAMTVQLSEDEDVKFGDDMRYAQSSAYLNACGETAGLTCVLLEPTMLRNEAGTSTPAAITIYQKTTPTA
jgi:predicted TPR repeat methyltransferase